MFLHWHTLLMRIAGGNVQAHAIVHISRKLYAHALNLAFEAMPHISPLWLLRSSIFLLQRYGKPNNRLKCCVPLIM